MPGSAVSVKAEHGLVGIELADPASETSNSKVMAPAASLARIRSLTISVWA